MNTQIEIKENGTTTLATAGKYCDRNIDVNVEVSGDIVNDADKILDGSFSGVYYSENITVLKNQAFRNCTNITEISLPNCTTLEGTMTFNGVPLTVLNLPNLTTVGTTGSPANRNFAGIKVKEIYLPNLETIIASASMFRDNKQTEVIRLPKLSGQSLSAYEFSGDSNLRTLILGGSVLNTLANTNAFTQTPIASGAGYIYVPDELVETYKTATNWSTFANQIKPISELEE